MLLSDRAQSRSMSNVSTKQPFDWDRGRQIYNFFNTANYINAHCKLIFQSNNFSTALEETG